MSLGAQIIPWNAACYKKKHSSLPEIGEHTIPGISRYEKIKSLQMIQISPPTYSFVFFLDSTLVVVNENPVQQPGWCNWRSNNL